MERLRLKLSLPEGGPAGQGPTLNGNSTYRRVASESVICSAPYSMIAPATDNGLATRRADQIASLKPFATRNATFFDALLALIRISSPVAGLRPLRAGRAVEFVPAGRQGWECGFCCPSSGRDRCRPRSR